MVHESKEIRIVTNVVIDRRKNGKGKSTGNRQKFIKRSKELIKEAVKDAVNKKSITDITDSKGEIKIPSKGISEPHFRHGEGGDKHYILPGNDDKSVGDIIKKPEKGKGGGTDGSPDGEGEDEFTFNLTQEEFLDFFFEDLELPDMVKKQLKEIDTYKLKRAGFTTSGAPSNLNIIRSMRNALGRRMALQSPFQKEIDELKKKIEEHAGSSESMDELLELLIVAKRKRDGIPYIDDIDIRYNSFEKRPEPSTQAVMFCIMDVSGSMGEYEKDLAKRFFMLLYIFLKRYYEKIEVVFIRHHSTARECTEHEFFYDRESGGTKVSTALEVTAKIIKDRYSSANWNIYGAQASDGDNWDGDDCVSLLTESILPLVQYYAYVQVGRDTLYSNLFSSWNSEKPLWNDYKKIVDHFKNFAMDQIDTPKDIFPVFKELFKKKE